MIDHRFVFPSYIPESAVASSSPSSSSNTFSAPAYRQRSRPELNLGKFINSRIQLNGLIGTGDYGAVYSAYDVFSKEKLAVKALPKINANSNEFGENNRKRRKVESVDNINARYISFDEVSRYSYNYPHDRAYREACLHLKVHGHPNILSILEILDSPDYLYLVLEYFPRGDLFHCITDLHWYVGDDASAKAIFSQVADAVAYCHKNEVYHCDLKPENILVSNDGSTVKLADFGLATSKTFTTDFGCGSTFYMAPERIKGSEYSQYNTGFSTAAADSWALGIILLNLTCGRNPWRKASKTDDGLYKTFLCDDYFLPRILPVAFDLNKILLRVLKAPPNRRPNPETFLKLVASCKHLTARVPAETNSTPEPASVPIPTHLMPESQPRTIGNVVSEPGSQSTSYFQTPVIGTVVLPPTPVTSPSSENVVPVSTQVQAGEVAALAALAAMSEDKSSSSYSSLSSATSPIGLGLLPPFGSISPLHKTSDRILPPISSLKNCQPRPDHLPRLFLNTPSATPIVTPNSTPHVGSHQETWTNDIPISPPDKSQGPKYYRKPITTDQLPITPILS